MTPMQSTYDRLMDRLADSDEDCRKLEAENKELKAEVERLQAISQYNKPS